MNLESMNSKMTANFKLNDTKVTGAPETVNIPKKKKPNPAQLRRNHSRMKTFIKKKEQIEKNKKCLIKQKTTLSNVTNVI